MIELNMIEKTVRFLECPDCHHEVEIVEKVDNLEEEEELYCLQCGCIMTIESVTAGKIFVSLKSEKLLPVYVLLKSEINGNKVHLVVKRRADSDVVSETADTLHESDVDFLNSQRYFYDVACPPSLFLRNLVCIIGESENISGAMFEYVATKEAKFNEENRNIEAELKSLFAKELADR